MVRDAETASGTIGFLYGINVLGAAAGALATPWVFIRHHGIETAVLAAVAAQPRGRARRPRAGQRGRRERPERGRGRDATRRRAGRRACAPPRRKRRGRFATWLALYALSGFCALALEILWFRIMDVAVKSTAYTFGTVLAVYLLGSAVGSARPGSRSCGACGGRCARSSCSSACCWPTRAA